MLLNFYIFVSSPKETNSFFLLLISDFFSLWSENIICIISNLLNILRFILWPSIWSNLENVPHALENIYYAAAGWWCVLYISAGSGWFILLFPCWPYVKLFCPLLKVQYWSLPVITELFLPSSLSVSASYILVLLLGSYIFITFIYLVDWTFHHYKVSLFLSHNMFCFKVYFFLLLV